MTAILEPGGPVAVEGDLLAPGYHVMQHLSRGAALDVYEVFSQERLCSCVAKTVRPDRAHEQRVRDRLLHEGHLLETLAHPHLLRGFETVCHPVPIVITETLPGLDLEELLDQCARRPSAAGIAHLGSHLCSAVHYLHGKGVLHLDIRPANVLAHAGLATLIDLSLARAPGSAPRGTGTSEYLAPEQARGEPLTAAADVWGLGVTLYEAATDVRPFLPLDEDEEQLLDDHQYLQLLRPAPPIRRFRRGLPRPLTDVIERCLAADPAARPSILQLAGVLAATVGAQRPRSVDSAFTPAEAVLSA